MPPPRKSPMRHRQRRSRSRSYSPRRRSRSGSRSLSRSGRDRRRSRSPQRKRSPERKYRSPHRRSPSPRRRSRSPKRRSRSRSPRSKFPQRRSRSLSPRRKSSPPRRLSSSRRISPRREASPKQLSPLPENYPVKRPADSSMKRQSYRSPSPSPVKRAKEERVSREKSPVEKSRYSRNSPSPERAGTSFERAKYADQPSSSKKPLFPAASSKVEIDFVTILDKGQKKEKLNKRFETLEQVAHGPFDFEENITIGIHRGPQHIELDEDEDMEINYEFNPKTFKMLFPKKEYLKPIFERDEIKAFRHDEILDEEAYVEKRTISVKPVEKPKSRKYEDELDYKVTVDRDREGLGDRRMVHDSRAGSKPSRSRYHDDVPVTVRLDPKPDPRYEKMYREQQRFEDQSLMQEKVQRNPNDLRYSLMRRKSDGDWDRGLVDARSRIEARRQEGHGDEYHSRPTERRVSSFDRKKLNSKTELPDFKNRPDDLLPPEGKRWGYCSICNIPLNSERQALEHINSEQHLCNEEARENNAANKFANPAQLSEGHWPEGRARLYENGIDEQGNRRMETAFKDYGRKAGAFGKFNRDDILNRKRHRSSNSDVDVYEVKRRSIRGCDRGSDVGVRTIGDELAEMSDGEDYPRPEDFENLDGTPHDVKPLPDHGDREVPAEERYGDSKGEIRYVWIVATEDMMNVQKLDNQRGLQHRNINIIWNCVEGLQMKDVLQKLQIMKETNPDPCAIILHVGRHDIGSLSALDFKGVCMDVIESIQKEFPHIKIIWSQILPGDKGLNNIRILRDDEMAAFVLEGFGHYIRYPSLGYIMNRKYYRVAKEGEMKFTKDGEVEIKNMLHGGILSILDRNMSIVPSLTNLPTRVSSFVKRNMNRFGPKTRHFIKASYARSKYTFRKK